MKMSYSSGRILPPGASRKRKVVDAYYSSTSSKPLVPVRAVSVPIPAQQPLSSNRLIAGYMAHEFLTNGTILGQNLNPARAEAEQVGSSEGKRNKHRQLNVEGGKPSGNWKPQSYAEVAKLLRIGDGAYIPGVVNPTQLVQWIQM